MHRYAQMQDADENGVTLDLNRAAVASTVSKPGHTLYLNYRKLLEAESTGGKVKLDPKTTRKRVRANLVANGVVPASKP